MINSDVGGLERDFYFFQILGIVTFPSDELIFFRGVGIPPTRFVFGPYEIVIYNFGDILLLLPSEISPWKNCSYL